MGYVPTFPLYYRLANDSLYDVSQRLLEVVRRLDPNLQTASVMGWNALHRIGTYTGMVLAGAGLQVSEAESLLTNTTSWIPTLNRLQVSDPEATEARSFSLGEYK